MPLLPKGGKSDQGDDLEAYASSAGAAASSGRAKARRAEEGASFSGLRVSLMPSELAVKAPPDFGRGLLVLAFALVVETLLIGGAYVFVRRTVEARVFRRDALVAEIGALDATVAAQESAAADAVRYGSQVAAAKKALDARVNWTAFFSLLEAKTKPTVKYVNFSGDADTGVVTLDAVGTTYRDVAEQIVTLREDARVTDVRTTTAAAQVNEAGEISGVAFTMVIRFKPGAWSRAVVPNRVEAAPAAAAADAGGVKDCGNAGLGEHDAQVAQLACTKGRFQECLPTKFTYRPSEDQEQYTEIKGFDGSGRCLVYQKNVKDYDPDFAGKEMTCALVPGEHLSLAFASAARDGLKDCVGSMVAAYQKDSSR